MSFPGQVVQFGGNLIGGLLGGQGFDTSRWPARDPQGFVRQEAEAWKPIEFNPNQFETDNSNLNLLNNTGDRSLSSLLAYSDKARQQNKQDAAELLAQQNAWQRAAAQEFTLPALAFKGQMGLLQAMASRPQQPIKGLDWSNDPKNQVLRHPLA